jgi:O-succinylbenzoic acid--CoA ligase
MEERPLVATLLDNPGIAGAAIRAWDAGEAILPLPVSAPRAEFDALLARARPTHLIDAQGRHRLDAGVPVAAGTAAVIATSGTTGTPKLVELTRAGLDVMARGYTRALDAAASDCWLACLPLHHVASLAIVARAYGTGIPFVVHEMFDLERVARSHAADGATMVSLVPTVLARLLDAGAPLGEFRCIIVGGAVLPPGLRARAEAAGARIADAYGLSETWGGCAIDGVANDGVELALAGDGEILVRGAPVMRGYRFAPEATAEVLDADGWLHTGDVGRITGARVEVVDRKKDLVISGGVNVSPTEVEQVLAEHPLVADVCVLGETDEEWGERVVAVVVPADRGEPPTLASLREFGRERLAAAKLPRELRLVAVIPRSASGKALRRALTTPR